MADYGISSCIHTRDPYMHHVYMYHYLLGRFGRLFLFGPISNELTWDLKAESLLLEASSDRRAAASVFASVFPTIPNCKSSSFTRGSLLRSLMELTETWKPFFLRASRPIPQHPSHPAPVSEGAKMCSISKRSGQLMGLQTHRANSPSHCFASPSWAAVEWW